MSKGTQISVVIITFNEENNIRETIAAVSKLTDDIIVIDSFSTDATPAICRELGTTFIQQRWIGYGKQKNTGHVHAKYDWILSIDADEVVSPELCDELIALPLDKKNQLFNIPFKTYFCHTLIRFGGWNPQYHVRLFNKTYTEWDSLDVHETLRYPSDCMITTLSGTIHHYSYDSMEEYISKSNTYTSLFAERLHSRGKKATWLKIYVSPAFTFFKEYIVKLGFLDGYMGLKIAQLNYNYTKMKYTKLKKLQ